MNTSDIKEVVLRVNGTDALKKIEELNKRLKTARENKEQLEAAHSKGETWSDKEKKSLARYTKEIEAAERQLKNMHARSEEVRRTLNNLGGANLKDLGRTLKSMQAALNSGKVARGSKEWDTLTAAIRRTKEEIAKVRDEQKAATSMTSRIQKLSNDWMGFVTTMQGTIAALTGVKAVLNTAVQDYAAMEEEMAGVRKYTGLADEEVKALNEDFKKMDTRTARERLNQLAGDAGRLGITARQEILDFVEAADMINVALGEDLGEDAVKNIGKLADVFGDKQRMGLKQSMLSTASAINELAQSSSASEPYILDFTARLAATGRTAGLTQAQIMGLASGFDQSKMDCEKAATALTKVFTKLMQDPAKAARVAGLEVKAFTELVRTDANAALLQFARGLSKYDRIGMTQALADLKVTGAGVSDALKLLASDTDRFREAQELAARAFREGTSVQKEFAVQNNTVQAGLDKARKRFHEVSVELGERLMPVASGMLSVTGTFMRALNVIIGYMATHKAMLTQATVVLAAYAAGVALSSVRWREYLSTKLLAMAAEKAHMVLVRAQIALSALWSAATALLRGNLVRATAAFRMFCAAMSANPLGALLTMLALVGVAVYNLCTRTKKLTAEQQRLKDTAADLADVEKRVADSTAAQIADIRMLDAVMRDNNRSMDDRRRAAERLNSIIPGYNAQIDASTGKIRANTAALNDHIAALKKEAMAKALGEKLADLAGQELVNTESLRRRQTAVRRRQDKISVLKAEAPAGLIDYMMDGGRWQGEETAKRFKLDGFTGKNGWSKWWFKFRQLSKSLAEAEGWADEQEKVVAKLQDRSRKLIDTAKGMGVDVAAGVQSGGTGTGSGGGATGGSSYGGTGEVKESERKAAARLKEKEVEARLRREEAELAARFAAGQIETWEDYRTRLYETDKKAIEDKKRLWQKGDSELLDLDKELAELERKHRQDGAAWSLRQEDIDFEQRQRAAKQRYYRENLAEEEHQAELDRLTLDHLRVRRDFLRDPANRAKPEDVRAADEAYEAEEARQAHDRELRRLEAIRKLKEQYMRKSAQERMDYELAVLDRLYPEELRKTEEYLRMRQAIEEKYRGADGKGGELGEERKAGAQAALKLAGYDDGRWQQRKGGGSAGGEWGGAFVSVVDSVSEIRRAEETYRRLRELREQDKISVADYNAACAELDKGRYDRLQAVAQAAYASVSAVMSSASQLMQANASLEEAKVTARYDREIEAAGSSTKKGKQLEEQKQKELAAIKTRYNKRAMAVELAQAVAQTALNAIMAYGAMAKIPVVGPALGIAAAAAATAAGMLQIATIKKQHEAEAAGYYGGGFTGGTRWRREAGVVHEGEFVANHLAVRNPNVLPVLRLIDHAQRTNTVASLTADDVSRAIGSPSPDPVRGGGDAAAAPLPQAAPAGTAIEGALTRLSDRLDEGIAAYVVIDGPDGLHRQYTRYQRMLARK